MKKLFLGIIEKKPLIWFHYLPLVGVVFLAHWLSDIIGIEGLVLTNPVLGWSLLVAWYYIFLLIGDGIIHRLIGEY